MAHLTDYGQTIAGVTAGLTALIATTTAPAQVTARMPIAARAGQSEASINLFLYQDVPTRYRVGGEPASPGIVIGTELRYLVTAYPAHKTDPDASSQVLYGAARAAVENNPALSVTLPSGVVRQVRLGTTSLGIAEHTALWIASDAAMRLSFVTIATVDLSTVGVRSATASIADLTAVAAPGVIAVLSGTDAAAKPVAAAAIASTLGRPLLVVDLGRVVSRYIGETEHNLAGLFERADRGGAILFFDEAEALFGRRSEVRESHDRYADANPARILDLLSRAPGPVLVSVTAAGEALLARQTIDVPFPPS
jgi:hypothetical protein